MSGKTARPLVITDCDEVLLHMVRHFRDWLDEAHAIDFLLDGDPFIQSFRRRESDAVVSEAEMWDYLNGFFDSEMDRQTEIPGAVAAINELQREADVVVLTNLLDHRNATRTRQLQALGIDVPVFTNQGPKGGALARIVADHRPGRVVFIDDIAKHHESVAQVSPAVHRLHFCGEPAVAPHIPCAHVAGHAHARIDTWDAALPWLLETLHGEPA
jgi:hypothetical protein